MTNLDYLKTTYKAKGYHTKVNKNYLVAVNGHSIINQRITNTTHDLTRAKNLLK